MATGEICSKDTLSSQCLLVVGDRGANQRMGESRPGCCCVEEAKQTKTKFENRPPFRQVPIINILPQAHGRLFFSFAKQKG